MIAPLSNGHVALLVSMSKSLGLPWDMIFGADLFRHYKPDPETYLGAAALFGCAPGEVMMVASHPSDLAGAAAPAPAAPAPAAPAPAPVQMPAATMKTASQCDAEYAANKAAIKASGQTKRAFVAACRAGTETIPQGAAAAPAPAPASAPAQNTGSLFPWQQPAAPAPTATAAPTGAGQFASEQQAKYRCPSDTVVWVNTNSGVYHFSGTHSRRRRAKNSARTASRCFFYIRRISSGRWSRLNRCRT